MENQEPESLEIASELELAVNHGFIRSGAKCHHLLLSAVRKLRQLHARVEELEAMLDAVGAGGVSAQRVTQAADHITQDRKMVAVPVEVPKVGSTWHHKNGNAYRVVAIANNCDAHFSERYPVTVVYQGENGKMWARRADDWHRSMTHDSAAPATAPVVPPEPVAAQVRKVMLAINEERLKKAKSHNTYIVGVIADKIENGTLFDSGIYRRREIAEIVRNLLSTVTELQVAAQEPFGYFKAEPFGWRDCAETDEGAIALYEAPQPQADARDAQRYRWLRAQPLESDMFCTTIWRKGSDGFGDDLRLEELDAAIDAAIAAAKEI